MNTCDILMALLRSELCGAPVGEEVALALRGGAIGEVVRVAEIHDLAHVALSAMEGCGAIERGSAEHARLEELEEGAFYRYRRLEHATGEIKEILADAGIPHLPLKGAVMRPLYPSPLMRMSADIDILVPTERLDSAVAALCARGYTTDGRRDFHDISLYSPLGVHLELHYNVKENDPRLDPTLSRARDYARPRTDGSLEYEFTPEFFAFHIFAHLTYHFINGGCGVKPFSDLWLLRHKVGYDEAAVKVLADECGVAAFYDMAVLLSEVWFSGAEHTPLTRKMEGHVLLNSICGRVNKGVVLRQSRRGGRAGYVLGRIFMPYSQLKIRYPAVGKCPLLLPVFEVVRWCSLLFGDKTRVKKELADTKTVTAEQMDELGRFMHEVGLDEKA